MRIKTLNELKSRVKACDSLAMLVPEVGRNGDFGHLQARITVNAKSCSVNATHRVFCDDLIPEAI